MKLNKSREARSASGLFFMDSFKLIRNFALDLIFPPRCYHCGRVDTAFCNDCQSELSVNLVNTIFSDVTPMAGLLSTGSHSGVLQAGIQALKYGNRPDLGELFSKRIEIALRQINWTYDTVIPVPLFTERLQKRGYNQAKVISEPLAHMLQLNHDDSTLIRVSQKRSQVGLNQMERIENVQGAFQIQSDDLAGKTVLLIDDVKTTGATMAECATQLIAHGVQRVYGITVSTAEYS